MSARTGVPVEEYLHTSFPGVDKEYRDGELVERSLPTYQHGRIQGVLFALFFALRPRVAVYPCVETRMKVRTGLYRIPDVSVFFLDEPPEVPESPPLIAIEILSQDDRMASAREKLEEYRNWGVKHVWLVDPQSQRMYTCDGGLAEVAKLTVPELNLEIQPSDIFQ
jgi:Uma2 family endonuclease